MAFTANCPALSCSGYTVNRPSGDQTGLKDSLSSSRTGAPPSTGILNRRVPSPRLAATATHLPSGDQEAVPRTSKESAASVRTFVPLVFMTYRPAVPFVRYEKQI